MPRRRARRATPRIAARAGPALRSGDFAVGRDAGAPRSRQPRRSAKEAPGNRAHPDLFCPAVAAAVLVAVAQPAPGGPGVRESDIRDAVDRADDAFGNRAAIRPEHYPSGAGAAPTRREIAEMISTAKKKRRSAAAMAKN